MQLESQETDAIEPDRIQVAEEQRQNEDARNCKAQCNVAFAQPNPGNQRPKREPDAEDVIHCTEEKDDVVEEGKRNQRQYRPTAEKAPVEGKRAREDQDEACGRVNLAR